MKFNPTGLDMGPMAMDLLHIETIFEATKLLPYGKVAVEIGSYDGVSTSALIQAMNHGYLDELHIIETHVRPSLLKVLDGCIRRERVYVHRVPSWEADIENANLVVIDGDHMWPAIRDLVSALDWWADIIISHDSILRPDTIGSHHVYKLLLHMGNRNFYHDNKPREGMRTERGLVISAIKNMNIQPLIKCLEQ